MANFNKVILLGNLTRDPELRYTQSGMAVAKLGMAVNRKYTAGGEQRESTTFVDMTAWGRQAEVLNEYCKKGRPLFVEGRLEYSEWEGQDGNKRNKLEVVIENFQFVGGRADAEGGGGGGGGGSRGRGGRSQGGGGAESGAENFDDVPF